jgi:hypothetical protein
MKLTRRGLLFGAAAAAPALPIITAMRPRPKKVTDDGESADANLILRINVDLQGFERNMGRAANRIQRFRV